MCYVRTDCNRLSPTYSYIDVDIKMNDSFMFFVLLASYRLCMVVHLLLSTWAILPTITHPIHEYHVDIPWISVSLCGFRGMT
jgi:hypothetical protein